MWPRFRKFMDDYNKTYASDVEAKRRYQIFKVNMKTAKMLQDNEAGKGYLALLSRAGTYM